MLNSNEHGLSLAHKCKPDKNHGRHLNNIMLSRVERKEKVLNLGTCHGPDAILGIFALSK